MIRVGRMEIDKVGDVHLFGLVVHPAQIGFTHVVELVEVEVVAPQLGTVHLSVEKMSVLFIQQLFYLDLAFVDFGFVHTDFLNQLFECGRRLLRARDFAAFLADFG